MAVPTIDIKGCDVIPVSENRDGRGCLYELYRASWPGAFPTVQWNACASEAGVVRGVHVHVDYDEFYTLPMGRVVLALVDIRSDSPTFRHTTQFEWSDADGVAIVVPRGVAHVVWFVERSVLAFGLSGYWTPELDVLGCQWDDPALGFEWEGAETARSCRDTESGTFQEMLMAYERLARTHTASVEPR